MDEAGFRRLIEDLKRAWEDRDSAAAAALFTEDAVYRESPTEPPVQGREAIRRYFEEAAREELGPSLTIEHLLFCDSAGAVEWTYDFTAASDLSHKVYKGVALVDVRGNKVASWREYSVEIVGA